MKDKNHLSKPSDPDTSGEIRVRFAPSPTGYLHLGGARTALYNWLFARHNRGIFILRIEDTDRERSESRFQQQIIEDLQWLGLTWDEGPIFQHVRKNLYIQHTHTLIQNQKAYYCFCSPEELEKKKYALKHLPLHYDGQCRKIPPEDAIKRIKAGQTPSIRFRTPDNGKTELRDLIRKKILFDNREFDDFIIVRSDGEPTYNLTATVDDALMGITHVIRGDDHLSNTPKQIFLYQALGFPIPQFAHIPMIMGPDNTRLSKRHGSDSVRQYRELGYLPSALINYLALLGWAYDDRQTLFSISELIKKFDLKKVNKKASVFDPQKLDWINGKYIRQLPEPEFISLSLPFLFKAGLLDKDTLKCPSPTTILILLSMRERLKRFCDLPALTEFFFRDSIKLSEEAKQQIFSKKDNFSLLQELYEQLKKIPAFEEKALEILFQNLIKKKGLKLGDIVHPVRAAITGKTSSPGIFLTMVLLSKDRVLKRLKTILQQFEVIHPD